MKTARIERIDRFTGSWGFLSNFSPVPVRLNFPLVAISGDDFVYTSVEHAYQAAKTMLLKEREKFTWAGLEPGKAKRMGDTEALQKRKVLRPDWFDVNVDIMRELLMQKFYPTMLRRKLFGTLDALLIEGNTWHDVFWGVCVGGCPRGRHEPIGKNMLGQLLMDVRKHYETI